MWGTLSVEREIFLSLDTESINFDHHFRCGGWLNVTLVFEDYKCKERSSVCGTISVKRDTQCGDFKCKERSSLLGTLSVKRDPQCGGL